MQRFLCTRAMTRAAALHRLLLGPPSWASRSLTRPRVPPRLICSPRYVNTTAAAWTLAPQKASSGGAEQPQKPPEQQEPEPEPDPLHDKSMGLVQRFKRTFKQYGKVMIPVHLLTSSVWFGTFYYAAMKGVNVVPFLEYIGFPDKLVKLLENSQSGYALTAYAMYKIATPARYTVTLGGTSLSVKYLRMQGYMSTPPPVKEYLQEKMEETKERFSEKMEETKDRFSERMEETKEKFSERLQETKDKVAFRKKTE
ncbi:hypothetical protein AALO_G00258670 [Alosa alosa]|uniref:DUF1279 domain-containing protein n=1 Tax=Alosa alosa TaxID=278164 RepID=A0AAV6FTM3_9TELE|nr:uncharacterized protein C18orf19 homolog A [Alosa alosa]XP_048086139.1 uncharacterized protein C18orf19 homolog A [Alosa alosa]XP_048086140.1 uncharacterized protein C18orf19 homolog A [Alosa alosa]XP_048086141.1 uncharacterized protein C18orf19 homolog A [Alosa alosa]KAG5264846.1 hypothetical protein AALO_G00258670 [Alosa alosa]